MYKLKARFLHFVEESSSHLDSFRFQAPKLAAAQEDVKKLKNEKAALNATIQTLQFRIQEQEKAQDEQQRATSKANSSKLSHQNDLSMTSMQDSSASSANSNNNTNQTESELLTQIQQLKQQVSILKNDNTEQRNALLQCRINLDNEQKKKMLLQSKFTHLQDKYSKLESMVNGTVYESMTSAVQQHLSTYQSLSIDFEQFLSSYQSSLLNHGHDYCILHDNIAHLQYLLDSKCIDLVDAGAMLFEQTQRMHESDRRCAQLALENQQLNQKYSHLLNQHTTSMKTLKASIALQTDASRLAENLILFTSSSTTTQSPNASSGSLSPHHRQPSPNTFSTSTFQPNQPHQQNQPFNNSHNSQQFSDIYQSHTDLHTFKDLGQMGDFDDIQ